MENSAAVKTGLARKCWLTTRSLFVRRQPKAEHAMLGPQTAAVEAIIALVLPASRQEAENCLKQAGQKLKYEDREGAAVLFVKAAYGFVQYEPYDTDKCCRLLSRAGGLYEQTGEHGKAMAHYRAAAQLAKECVGEYVIRNNIIFENYFRRQEEYYTWQAENVKNA